MDNLGEMRVAVQDDLTIGDESSLFPPSSIDRALNRAYRIIGAMYRWDGTKDALKTSALLNHEYYDYPQKWRPNSIWKLTLDGVDQGDPLVYSDYLFEKENSMPSGLTKMWSNYGKRFFIYPIPTANGDKNISIHGYKFVDKMVEDGDITIFSYSMPEINEAIVIEAKAILKDKGDITNSTRNQIANLSLISPQARAIVINTWSKITQEEARLVRTTPQFVVPDFYATRRFNVRSLRSIKGNF